MTISLSRPMRNPGQHGCSKSSRSFFFRVRAIPKDSFAGRRPSLFRQGKVHLHRPRRARWREMLADEEIRKYEQRAIVLVRPLSSTCFRILLTCLECLLAKRKRCCQTRVSWVPNIGPWYLIRLVQWNSLARSQPMLVDPNVPHGRIAQKFQPAKPKLIIGICFGAAVLLLVALAMANLIATARK